VNSMIILVLLVSCLNLMLLAVLLFLVQRPDTASEKINYDNRELREMVLTIEKSLLNLDKKMERSLNSIREQSNTDITKSRELIINKLKELSEER